jgi:protein involved in polysaccharide export with SLBB domain
MTKTVFVSIPLVFALAGCTTKSQAQRQAREAFLAGQQQGLARATDAQRVNIRIIGPVKQPEIAWTEGLTLAQAIATAGYTASGDPKGIFIDRKRLRIPFDPQALLQGKDLPLEPGDTIEVYP